MNDKAHNMNYSEAKAFIHAGKITDIGTLSTALYTVAKDYGQKRSATAQRESALSEGIRLVIDNLFTQDYDASTGDLKVQHTGESKPQPEFDRAILAVAQGIVDAYGKTGSPADGLKYANKVMKARFTGKVDEDMTKAAAGHGRNYYVKFKWGNDALSWEIKHLSAEDMARKALSSAVADVTREPTQDHIVAALGAMVAFSHAKSKAAVDAAAELTAMQESLSAWVEQVEAVTAADPDQVNLWLAGGTDAEQAEQPKATGTDGK